jgi:hypothetical protein
MGSIYSFWDLILFGNFHYGFAYLISIPIITQKVLVQAHMLLSLECNDAVVSHLNIFLTSRIMDGLVNFNRKQGFGSAFGCHQPLARSCFFDCQCQCRHWLIFCAVS